MPARSRCRSANIAALPFSVAQGRGAPRGAGALSPARSAISAPGISTGIASLAAEEDAIDDVVLTNEQGLIGGVPATGNEPGAGRNYQAMVDQPYQFDFYDGGGLDLAFLSFAEVDEACNVNVSRFGDKIVGPGGFINISQNAKTMIFSGTFTAGGLDIAWTDGQTHIGREGAEQKFVGKVQQVTYSGALAAQNGQRAFYVTERAVFRRNEAGRLELIEIAPGIDLERDILGADAVSAGHFAGAESRWMPGIFRPEVMGLAAIIAAKARPIRSQRLNQFLTKRLDKGGVVMAVAVTTKAKRPAPSAKAKAALEPVRDAERTRQALLAAAEIEFSTKGLAGARVDVIAEQAAANKRMLYYYFGSKEELYRRCAGTGLRRHARGGT